MKKTITIFLLLVLLSQSAIAVDDGIKESEKNTVEIYFFWGEGCPNCKELKPVLDDLEQKYPQLEVHHLEVYYNKTNLDLLQKMFSAYGKKSNAVPVTFIADTMIDGYFPDFTDERLERIVDECIRDGCVSPGEKLESYLNPKTTTTQSTTTTTQPPIEKSNEAVVYFFWGEGCPHCTYQKPFMEKLKEKYPGLEVKMFETWKNPKNADFLQEMAKAYGVRASGVPMTFIGDFEPTVGFGSVETTGRRMEEEIRYCIENGCINPLNKMRGEDTVPNTGEDAKNQLCIHAFIQTECPQCIKIKPYLESLGNKYDLNLVFHDLEDAAEKDTYATFKKLYGLEYAAYPVVFIGDSYFIGETAILSELDNKIISCLSEECICPAQRIRGLTPSLPGVGDSTGEKHDRLNIPLLGEVNIESMSIIPVTVLIGFLDGINPCSLWVITFLLAMVVRTRSRKRIIVVGLTYLGVTTVFYGLFIVGTLNVFLYIGYLPMIRVGVGILALIFAAVNIKDYFWFKKGISFTISEKHQKGIFAKIRNIRLLMESGSIVSIITATALMATGITLVELPCTAGFPVIWTSMITAQNISTPYFIFLLGVYLMTYLSLEVIIFTTMLFTLKTSKMEEKHGRSLKLLGGVIMLALALSMLFHPEIMDDLTSSLALFATAIGFTVVIMYIHRIVLPKYGIVVGSEDLNNEKNS